MFHPLIIGILTVNTSITIIYWTFILGDAYYKWMVEPEDKPKKVVDGSTPEKSYDVQLGDIRVPGVKQTPSSAFFLTRHKQRLAETSHHTQHSFHRPSVTGRLCVCITMTHEFYWGMHPVSWFILFANVAITIIEWQFLVSQFVKLSKREEKVSNS
ncbi:hypothetical protein D4764_15G0000160 [Takifugu flavidus]|uniref:Uncharacterized protein n=1 Tax=Takifugu flavidus TaxID=433684 RepID=A0A5C6NYM0_9TELE|nr:hypothetical protein D4764_15G0000160 [Takifugu flavidus]